MQLADGGARLHSQHPFESIDPLERLKALVKVAEHYQHCCCAGVELFREVEAAKGAINAAEEKRRQGFMPDGH